MKQIFLILILIIQFNNLLIGQQKKLQLHDIKFSHEIENEIRKGELRESSAAYYYTYIGEYKKALETYELHLDWGLDTMSYHDSIEFLNYKTINPFEYLSEKTKDEQIVIISEAHHKPQHRIFTTKLLKELYKNGFRYLGIETITPSFGDTTQFLMDVGLNKRGYPLYSPLTGHYTREPQMGNMVREAIKLGFEIFGYERTAKGKDRDLQQAINIERFINNHSNAKTVIHCGWYHAIESDFPKRGKDNYMAYHLKKITGINPLTIYQDALSEKTKIPESPFYKLINSKNISILIDEDGQIFNGTNNTNHFDIFIYHPKTTYLKNRPNWLFEIKGNQFVEIEKERIKKKQFPVIVKAFLAKENNSACPIDVIELKNPEDKTELILRSGNYRIVIIDKDRNKIEYTKEVK